MSRGELELRCFCERQPLLAVMGRDRSGEPYVHVKVFRSLGRERRPKLYAEVIVTGIGSAVRMCCRECFRWHKVIIRRTDVEFRSEQLPATLNV